MGDLLDLSRVEEGVTPLRVKEVRVIDIFDDAVAQARADGVRYSLDVRPVDLTVAADPDRLHQLLANLLDNAARHSPAGGEVRLSAERQGDDVQLAVADDGPGIAVADRSAVFERFTTSAAHSSGTGLGLAISRWVAQLHGGTIAVADRERGCRIEVTLPVDADRPTTRNEPVMSTLTPPAPVPQTPVAPPHDGLTTYWPDAPAAARASSRRLPRPACSPPLSCPTATSGWEPVWSSPPWSGRSSPPQPRGPAVAGPVSTPSMPASWRCY